MNFTSSCLRTAAVLVVLIAPSTIAAAPPPCGLLDAGTFQHDEVGDIPLFRDEQTRAIAFASQMQVNTDGAPDSYHPDDIGITHICNGVSLGASCTWEAQCLPTFRQAKAENFRGPTRICFFAMVADNAGVPVIQGANDPRPGFFVATTALKQPGADARTPAGQVDSNTVPFAVIPRTWQSGRDPGPHLGDFGIAVRRSNGKVVPFVIADIGPRRKLGEGSVALHQALDNDPFQMRFGVRRARRGIGHPDVFYVMFPGTAVRDEKFTAEMVQAHVQRSLAAFGGEERLRTCVR
jgi:hypothetical protein